ncbi:glycosyltransferase [Methanocaldococcus fervens]|uniref:Glycosyl transferase group 1 n=1 Tax=Methanocaldococcus fervens (strain DSM 4213 / JCM 15782 / AG86) TaxID=573064 RepID=C7P713_METFA|nr:glycosyltransferase [Methanocaldococcus fervens]ACV24345.1 glycosyl transferase group 1 [Methanocaldococcus fervens AG86]
MKKIKLGVIYALPEKYATSIRIKNLTERLENVEIIKIQPNNWPNNLFGKILVIIKNCLKVLNPKFKPDVVYASAPLIASSIPAILAKKIKKIPLIIDWDDCFVDFSKYKPKPWNLCYWEYLAVKNADKVVVVSDKLKELAMFLGKKEEDIEYIPNGVDLNLFNPEKYKEDRIKIRKKYKIKDDEIVVGFVGNINDLGNNNFVGKDVVNCAIKLKKEGILDKFRFLIVGFGSGLNLFKDYVKKNEIKDRFIFTGYVKHEDIPKYISAMDVALIPVGKNFTDLTRSSCKLKEFMAMEKIVITVNFGSFKKETINGKYALLVDNNEDFHKILKMLDKHKYINKNLRNYIKQNYDYKILSERLENIIFEVVKNCKKCKF